MRNFKNQRGITLVALVVTIIVLLILAGVTLSLVAGENGILGRATNAVDRNEIGTAREQAGLLISDLITGYYEAKYVNSEAENTSDARTYVFNQIGSGRPTDSGEYTVTKDDTANTITVKKSLTNKTTGTVELKANMSDGGRLTNWQYKDKEGTFQNLDRSE